MGIQIGNVTVNDTQTTGSGIVNNGQQLVCSCGNTSRWGDITMTNDRTVADCGVCGERVEA